MFDYNGTLDSLDILILSKFLLTWYFLFLGFSRFTRFFDNIKLLINTLFSNFKFLIKTIVLSRYFDDIKFWINTIFFIFMLFSIHSIFFMFMQLSISRYFDYVFNPVVINRNKFLPYSRFTLCFHLYEYSQMFSRCFLSRFINCLFNG